MLSYKLIILEKHKLLKKGLDTLMASIDIKRNKPIQ
jgi:hypothetical protein